MHQIRSQHQRHHRPQLPIHNMRRLRPNILRKNTTQLQTIRSMRLRQLNTSQIQRHSLKHQSILLPNQRRNLPQRRLLQQSTTPTKHHKQKHHQNMHSHPQVQAPRPRPSQRRKRNTNPKPSRQTSLSNHTTQITNQLLHQHLTTTHRRQNQRPSHPNSHKQPRPNHKHHRHHQQQRNTTSSIKPNISKILSTQLIHPTRRITNRQLRRQQPRPIRRLQNNITQLDHYSNQPDSRKRPPIDPSHYQTSP